MNSVKKSNVPESVPAPNSLSETSGKPGRMSFQLSTFEPVFHTFFSSAVVRHVAHVFCGLIARVIPSFATVKATHLMPFSLHWAYSEALIALEAFARSISPRQNFSKPPPVPEIPTVMRTFGWTFRYISAAEVVHGPTVLEPSAVMLPASCGDELMVVAPANGMGYALVNEG